MQQYVDYRFYVLISLQIICKYLHFAEHILTRPLIIIQLF